MIDAINRKILCALQEDARISFSRLGERVHLSAPAVAERVRKMETAGVISGYGLKVDLDKLGYPIIALVQCMVFRSKEKAFKQLLSGRDEVIECYNVTGDQAFIIKVAVKSLALLDDVLEAFCTLSDTNTMVVLKEPVQRVLPGDFGA